MIIGSFAWNLHHDKQEFRSLAQESARAFFEQIILDRSWNASHGGIYVPITESSPPNPYLVDPLRDVTTTDGLQLTKINPAYMTKQISEIASKTKGVQFHITSLNPIRPGNKPTEWEAKWLKEFENGAEEKFEFIDINHDDADKSFRYMAPLYVEQACLNCHEQQGYKLGDIRGGISITLPHFTPRTDISLYTSHGVALFIGLFGIIIAGVLLGNSHRHLLESNKKKEEALQQSRSLSKKLKQNNLELEKSQLIHAEVHNKLESSHLALSDAHKELKETQVQMLQNDKMASIGQLAAGIAHEINNPLGFITSNLGTLYKYVNRLLEFIAIQDEILKKNDFDKEITETRESNKIDYIIDDSKDLLTESIDGAKRVSEIVQNLKSFARIDQEKIIEANINECFDNTLKIIWNELKYKVVVVKEYGDIPLTYCNPQELNQVFMNIIINASHAIETKGEIKIVTEHSNDSIIISISDNGDGIKAENIEHIFEPFFSTKEIGKGTGLGLSICYDIIKKHNGNIEVKSEIGVGTTFSIILPIKTTDPTLIEKISL